MYGTRPAVILQDQHSNKSYTCIAIIRSRIKFCIAN